MTRNPLVSIVLPTYNGSRYLDQAIQSCLDQTYTDWELIIVDDGSADDTPAQIAHYVASDKRIRSVRHETNRQLPAALNTGFPQAKGSYFTWTSDDNCYRPNALAEMVAFLENHPEVGVVYTDYTVIDAEGCPTRYVSVGSPDKLAYENFVGACFMYRRAVHEKIGAYAEDLFLAEDYDFWCRTAASFRMHPLHKDLYFYRWHTRAIGHRYTERAALAIQETLKRNLPAMDWVSGVMRAKGYLRLAKMSQAHDDSRSARLYLCYAIRYCPFFVIRELSPKGLVKLLLGSRGVNLLTSIYRIIHK